MSEPTTKTKPEFDFDDVKEFTVIKLGGHEFKAYWPTNEQVGNLNKIRAEIEKIGKDAEKAEAAGEEYKVDEAKIKEFDTRFNEALDSFIIGDVKVSEIYPALSSNVTKPFNDFLGRLLQGE